MNRLDNNGPYNIFAEVDTIIEFYDVDPMCVVWHGNYFKYFEMGRRSLLEKIGYTYEDMKESGYAFPVIETSAKYLGSLKFRDRVRIKAILAEYENRMKINYEIRIIETGVLATKGMSIQMALDMNTRESCFVCPKVFTDKVEALIRE
jgi:acyl-CoA thioester hydrolase